YRSDVAVPAATVYEHKGVLMLSSGATNLKFTNYDFRHIFRLSANDKSNAEIMAKHIYDEGYINVYILYERGLYGTDFSNYFIEYASAAGLRIPGQAFYEERENDFLPVLSSLRSAISPINLTDEVALLKAKLQQTKRIEQIRQLSGAATKNASIVQFLVTEQKYNNTSYKFFDSMPRVKLLHYLEQELAQSDGSEYLQMLFKRNQDELSLMSSATQYAQLDLLVVEIRQWMAELKLLNDSMILPKEQANSLMNQRIVTRKAIDFDSDDTGSKLNQMLNRITRIQSGEVDAIFMAGFMPEAAQAILQARNLNLNLPIFGGHTFIDLNNHCKRLNNCASYGEVYALVTHDFKEYRQVYDAMHHEAQEYKSCHPKGDKCLPERYSCDHFETAYVKFQKFSAAYQKKYGQLPDNWAVQGFLATSIIQETIKAAHTFDPEVLADTLLHQGNSEFTDKGLMFSCNSLGITEGDVLVEGMKIRKLEDLQESN
ncbi:MAG: ABC transporter substrate-binding protein, partial [Pararheinheimera sp.]|nr:ABC transporter substrate-binding protein [Rheinheimera sp.]